MNKKTLEALKRIINQRGYHYASVENGRRDYEQVENWINGNTEEWRGRNFIKEIRANNKT